jgi:hypothetical protein
MGGGCRELRTAIDIESRDQTIPISEGSQARPSGIRISEFNDEVHGPAASFEYAG